MTGTTEVKPKEQFLTITKLPDGQFAVWFDEFDIENKLCFTATKIASVKRQLYEEDGEPLLKVSKDRMQKVMDDLWEFGLRPKEMHDGKETE